MKFEIYRDRSGEFRWRLVSKNGKVVADSAEGYVRRDGAVRAAWTVCLKSRWADIVERECDR